MNDVVVVGAGAAGLATAIFARRLDPRRSVLLLDGAAKPGAKILVSGGSRCNVTNAAVTERDYWGGKRTIVRRVLRALPVAATVDFFQGLGVALKEEPHGKLFPTTDRSRDVLDALLRAAASSGVTLAAGTRVHEVLPGGSGFSLQTSRGPMTAASVVLATGGLSLPKTGSDGGGLTIARRLGHSIMPTTPALAPLLLSSEWFHAGLSGVAVDVELTVWVDGRVSERIRGSMLWTHFGLSGPVALDASRVVLRAQLEQRPVMVSANFFPPATFDSVDARWATAATSRPRTSMQNALADELPASVASALLAHASIDGGTALGALSRHHRRALAHALTGLPLPVTGSRGYNYAEATAGGVSLDEVDPAGMGSRRVPGLFLVGEMLDVDGRIGGFNFQWAWSSARAAAEGLARRRA
ncbi:MAG TPA: aminoacetone oxidase family FAD-binding enzyme [Vicinamibacterales bacterium]|nr:aminoacetone oxidase family FAD-binding enzyme [Vicinamibacterales bacterium]